MAAGQSVDVVVGDFDSVQAETLRDAEAVGVEVVRHDRDKDEVDLELALDLAVERGATAGLVLGGAGGRLDHLAGNLTLLASPRYADLALEAWMGDATVWVIRGRRSLELRVGTTVSLIPMHGSASAVVATGLRWPLDGDELLAGSSRGVSNVVTANPVEVAAGRGVLLLITPG